MLILPHSTALDLDGHAYTTYAVALLCIIIFYFQFNNNVAIQTSITQYCESIYTPELGDESLDVMRADPYACENILDIYHNDLEHLIPELLAEIKDDQLFIFTTQQDKVTGLMQAHYDSFQKSAPEYLDAKLMYYPDVPNPIKMVTSSLAHADFSHIFFNLIFFLAFAPALELLIGNVFKYLGVLLIIAFATSISYSLVTLFSASEPIPTLGLSGVVMGMIGLSAYLMPKAKIRVLVWLIFYVRNFYISAWVLALWYIGWDTWELFSSSDHGGVNVIAHVSGGFTGYLIGMFWLKETRARSRDELADEIEYQRSQRADRHTAYNVSFSGNRQYLADKQQQRQFIKNNDEYLSRLYQYVKCGNDSEAMVLILDDYDFQRAHVENYEELFQHIAQWGSSRTLLCVGRICISLLLEQRLYKRALNIFKQCHQISADFVLADAREVLLLARGAIDLQQYEAARDLICHAEPRYGQYIDATRCQLLEIELLLQHLNNPQAARSLMNALLANGQSTYKNEILALAKQLQNCY